MSEEYAKILRRLELLELVYTWHKITDPGTGWLALKTSGWTADSFSGGLEVNFSGESWWNSRVKAVRVVVKPDAAAGVAYWRPSGDTNVANTPNASSEYAFRLSEIGGSDTDDEKPCEIWLSADGKAQFAVTNTGMDLYIAYPIEVMS